MEQRYDYDDSSFEAEDLTDGQMRVFLFILFLMIIAFAPPLWLWERIRTSTTWDPHWRM